MAGADYKILNRFFLVTVCIVYLFYIVVNMVTCLDVEDAVCAVTSAQYLSASGWVALRDLIDNDVPFGLYRDEGSTYLQVFINIFIYLGSHSHILI